MWLHQCIHSKPGDEFWLVYKDDSHLVEIECRNAIQVCVGNEEFILDENAKSMALAVEILGKEIAKAQAWKVDSEDVLERMGELWLLFRDGSKVAFVPHEERESWRLKYKNCLLRCVPNGELKYEHI